MYPCCKEEEITSKEKIKKDLLPSDHAQNQLDTSLNTKFLLMKLAL